MRHLSISKTQIEADQMRVKRDWFMQKARECKKFPFTKSAYVLEARNTNHHLVEFLRLAGAMWP